MMYSTMLMTQSSILLEEDEKRKKLILLNKARMNKKKGINNKMKELLERYINKEVVLEKLNGATESGKIKEVADNAVILVKKDKEKIINLDYVVKATF